MAIASVRHMVDDAIRRSRSTPGVSPSTLGLTAPVVSPSTREASFASPIERAQSEPGGWNRVQLEVEDLAGEVEALRKPGALFRNGIFSGSRVAQTTQVVC